MASRDKKPAKPSSSRASGIRTLSDLNRRSGPDSDSDDEDAPQEYYTGGEKSGMLVQDPTKGNDVDAIFNQARQLGAVEGPLDNLNQSSSSRSFTGTGRLLSGESVPSAPQQPEAVVHNIVFWTNGFTVEDGPLRRLDDPENASFLECTSPSIRKSECPKELEPSDRRSSVHVNLIRRDQKCPEPEKQRNVAFQGIGRTLGSTSASPASEPTADSAPLSSAPAPLMGLVVDKTLPSTSIQLRLADGTRMVAHFNNSNTVNDIRTFIDASRPGGARNYQLQMMGFPPKLLTEPTQTIEQAGLSNSVVIQKF
ncbi:UBX DOMAIN CONTAINING PROTEIN [Salix viminalis]|uniref:UBX DOMAIN CONTAINING PROTEIN n=1 Tax=Salix viminalis TaxID=40686 RepID=A0A9Q0QHM9_SALVM|nr:UBX DOMAIN CONTAINING PROTEIN [Salix viminalis]